MIYHIKKGIQRKGFDQDANLDTFAVFTHTGSQSSNSLPPRHTHADGASLLGSVNYPSPKFQDRSERCRSKNGGNKKIFERHLPYAFCFMLKTLPFRCLF